MRSPEDAGMSATVYEGGRRQRLVVTFGPELHLNHCLKTAAHPPEGCRRLGNTARGRPPAAPGLATAERLRLSAFD